MKQYAQLYYQARKCKCLKAMRFHFLSKLTKIKEITNSADVGIKKGHSDMPLEIFAVNILEQLRVIF